MKIAGIIAEYDPFHNGHAWQLQAARAAGAQYVVVCLSTATTQRGALPLFPEEIRVQAALAAGADMVVSLPAVYAASGAEQFAQAGVALLAAVGCDTLVFGAETPDAEKLMGCAKALCSPEYEAALGAAMAQGARNFASARQGVMHALYPAAGYGVMLSNPNDNLAIEYCKAILQQKAALTPYPLPRVGAQHGQSLISNANTAQNAQHLRNSMPQETVGNTANTAPVSTAQYASGSALRKLWQTEGVAALRPYVPEQAYTLYEMAAQTGQYTSWEKVDIALLSRLRAAALGDFATVRGVAEGLEYRLADALKTATTAQELYDALTTVRYPRARMRRLCLDAALGVQQGAVPPLPPYLHILGGRKASLGLLKQAALPASDSLVRLAQENEACRYVATVQANVCDFGGLCRAKCVQMGAAYTQKIIVL